MNPRMRDYSPGTIQELEELARESSSLNKSENPFPSTFEEYSVFEINNVPDEFKRDIEFIDAYDIGRDLEITRQILLNIIEDDRDHLLELNKERYGVSYILWEILYIELRLRIIDICPNVQTQMQQHRQKIAFDYKGDEKSGDKSESTSDQSSNEERPPEAVSEEPIILDEFNAHGTFDKLTDWLYILSEEFEEILGFVPSNRTRLDMFDIINNPESFFKDEVWDWMDDPPKKDFKEACQALAFDSPTACVMISLRAVEYNLRIWYEQDTERNIEHRTWGQVVGELEDVYDDVDDRPSVLSNLDYLRERRNAVSHPEDSSTQREAERMLYRVEGTISEIYNQLN